MGENGDVDPIKPCFLRQRKRPKQMMPLPFPKGHRRIEKETSYSSSSSSFLFPTLQQLSSPFYCESWVSKVKRRKKREKRERRGSRPSPGLAPVLISGYSGQCHWGERNVEGKEESSIRSVIHETAKGSVPGTSGPQPRVCGT